MFGLVGYDTFDIYANVGRIIININIAMMVLSFVALILRFVARRIAKQPLMWDDWWILIAMPFVWIVVISEFVAVKTGEFGRHIEFATPTTLENFLKALYTAQLVYPTAICTIKFSILCFYRRIFSVPSIKIPMYILGGIMIAWWISTTFVCMLSCIPVHGFWDRTIPATCVNTLKYYLGVGIPNIVHDFALLILPIPYIWKLQMPNSQKVAVMLIFAIGGFIIIISSLRLVTVVQAQNDPDITWAWVPLGVWNTIELNVGVILACLPSMLPLLRLLLGQKLKSSNFKATPTKPQRKPNMFAQLRDSPTADESLLYGNGGKVQTHASANNVTLDKGKGPETGIKVRSNIHWESYRH